MGIAQETFPKRVVRTGQVNCRWLYNQLQAARGMILIDTRSRADFIRDSIPSAISIPPPHTTCRSVQDATLNMLEDQKCLFTTKKRKLRDVVLYGDTLKLSPDLEFPSTHQLQQLLVHEGLVTNVEILMDGFVTFQYRYPFLTREKRIENVARTSFKRTQSGRHNVNYPMKSWLDFYF